MAPHHKDIGSWVPRTLINLLWFSPVDGSVAHNLDHAPICTQFTQDLLEHGQKVSPRGCHEIVCQAGDLAADGLAPRWGRAGVFDVPDDTAWGQHGQFGFDACQFRQGRTRIGLAQLTLIELVQKDGEAGAPTLGLQVAADGRKNACRNWEVPTSQVMLPSLKPTGMFDPSPDYVDI